jgi:hypothetical protein
MGMADWGAESNVGLINSGYAARDVETQRRDAEAKREAEMNRVLHPDNQKFLAMVINGQLSPAQAAVLAHQYHDQLGTPHYSGPQAQGAGMPPPGPRPGGMTAGLSADRTVEVPLPADQNFNANGMEGAGANLGPVSDLHSAVGQPNIGMPEGMYPRGEDAYLSTNGMTSNPIASVARAPQQAPQGQRPYTVRDALDAEAISKSRRTDQIALQEKRNEGAASTQTLKNQGTSDVANIRGKSAYERARMKDDTTRAQMDQQAQQFSMKMNLEYDKLDKQMERLRVSIKGRKDAVLAGKDDKELKAARDREANEIKNIRNNISGMLREKVRASAQGVLNPEIAQQMDEEIHKYQRQLEDLELSQDMSQRDVGMRRNIDAPPGWEKPAPGPGGSRNGGVSYQPNQLGRPGGGVLKPPDESGDDSEVPTNDEGGAPPVDTSTPVKEPEAMRGKIKVKNLRTGQVAPIDVKVLATAKKHPNFNKMYQIIT